ncbi:MAG: polyisoprenoid-binding protein [Nitrospinae bacterium]|nr:polyisoprenoid-binding protein [Nitrospinota bacterium]
MKKAIFISFALALAVFFQPVFAAQYAVDKAHSNVGFSVKHMVISNVKGNFGDFAGTFSFDEKSKALTAANAVIKVASVNTNEPKRDDHLRSPDFFDAQKFPEMSFVMKKAAATGDKLRVTGDLTIRGVTKEVTLEGEFLGAVKDPWGNQRAGFTASGTINRNDFGVSFNKVLETGGLVVGNEVKLSLEIEGVQQK